MIPKSMVKNLVCILPKHLCIMNPLREIKMVYMYLYMHVSLCAYVYSYINELLCSVKKSDL